MPPYKKRLMNPLKVNNYSNAFNFLPFFKKYSSHENKNKFIAIATKNPDDRLYIY